MRFSVMVPCHNPRIDFLHQTLASVREQLGPDDHQLIIVDDRSDNLSAIALTAIKYDFGLVDNNGPEMGGVKTHNHAISLAYGDLVHILHPDDWVVNEFYSTVAQAAASLPDVALFASQHILCNERGIPFACPRPHWLTGPNTFYPLHRGNPLAVAATVVRKAAYDKFGGWREDLIHTGDWECWARMTAKGGAVAIDWPLACYRQSPQNHSGRLAKTGANILDYIRMVDIAATYMGVDLLAFRAFCARQARMQERQQIDMQDYGAAMCNAELARELEWESQGEEQ